MKRIAFVIPCFFLVPVPLRRLRRKKWIHGILNRKCARPSRRRFRPRNRNSGLKRKVAIGRMTNETRYGRSLIRDEHNDTVGKQLTDMLSNALTESGNFMVLERPTWDAFRRKPN